MEVIFFPAFFVSHLSMLEAIGYGDNPGWSRDEYPKQKGGVLKKGTHKPTKKWS